MTNVNRAYLRWFLPLSILAALLPVWWVTTIAPATPAMADAPPLLAFYYGWYDEQTWASGLSPDTPLQPYRSSDPQAIARHVGQARQAGIEALVMSWYGPQIPFNQTEPNFKLLLDEAHRQGIKAAVDFETRGPFFANRAAVVEGLNYLLDTHAQHPAYFKFNNKPVIFFWQQDRFSVEEWHSIRQEVDPHHTSLWIAEGTNLSYQFHFDGHHLYNIAWANDVAAELSRWENLVRWFGWFYDLERYWVATTMPGFDERHLDRPDNNYRPRGTGEFYKESWAAAMATEPDMLIITSFNEWIENSQIEPSVTYGNYYLELTRALRYNQPPPSTPVLPTPTPTPTPGRGSIIGLVTDAHTGDRLAGVTVSVGGQTAATDGEGIYQVDNVTEGLQTVVASLPGYLTAETSKIVVSGQLVWNSFTMTPGTDPTATATPTSTATATPTATPLPPLTPAPTATPLPPTNTPAPNTGTLIGLITNAQTGQRLSGVMVSANGQSVRTAGNGFYSLAGLPPGEYLVLARHPNFQPGSKTGIVLSNTTRWNSIALAPLPTNTPAATATPLPTGTPTLTPSATATDTPLPTATATATSLPTDTPLPAPTPAGGTLMGLITNAQTGQRLAGVTVSTGGQVMQTEGNGFYIFDNLPPGPHHVLAEHPDFEPKTQTGIVVSNQSQWNSMALIPRQQPTPTPTVPPPPTFTATPLPTATPAATVIPTPTQTLPPSPTFTATPLPTATSLSTQTATPAAQSGTLIGLITDAQTGERLPAVTVSVAGQTTTTDERGLYRFENVPAGEQVVRAEKEGYQPKEKTRGVVANEVRWNSIELAKIFSGCPTSSDASFEVIPIQNLSDPRPDYLHGDLNLARRGYAATGASLSLQDYAGGADPSAPQLAGLFAPNNFPGIRSVYRVNHWDWGCGQHGCRGDVITDWPVTLAGLRTTPGQAIFIPERGPQIYGGGYKALVLYAEERRITLGYTRDDTVATGYAVHIENVCVDPNLLALYRAQIDENGFRATNRLPALRNNQKLGVALNDQIQVAIRDRGAFMDPRSRKDWWQGY